MRRLAVLLLSAALIWTLTACGGTGNASGNVSDDRAESAETEATETSDDTLSFMEVDKGLLTVKVMIPASVLGETDEEEIARVAAEAGYSGYHIQEDGSVTYTMTKAKYNETLERMRNSVKELINNWLDGENKMESLVDVKYDNALSNFDFYVNGEAYSGWDTLTATLGLFSAVYYQSFAGTPPDQLRLTINFIDHETGAVLDSTSYPFVNDEEGENDIALNNSGNGEAENTATTTPVFQTVRLGDTISLDFVEITLKEVNFGERIYVSERDGSISPSNENNRLFCLSCALTNLMGDAFFLSKIKAKLTFDGKYNYEGRLWSDGNSSRMDPLVDHTIFIYAEVPPAILERYQTVTFRFAFNDNFAPWNYDFVTWNADFGRWEELESSDHRYELTYYRDGASSLPENGAETAESVAEPEANITETTPQILYLGFGDTVKTNDYEFTLNRVKFSYDVLPDDTSGYYRHYTPDSGHVYIDIDASVKNLMKRDITLGELFTAKALYGDGYTYSGFTVVSDGSRFNFANNWSVAAPLATCHAHCIIECPQEVEDSLKTLYVVIHLADGNDYRYYIR